MTKKLFLALILLIFSGMSLMAQGTILLTNTKGKEKIIQPGKSIAYSTKNHKWWMSKGKFMKAENGNITVRRLGKEKVLKVEEIKFLGYRTAVSVVVSILGPLNSGGGIPFFSGSTFKVVKLVPPGNWQLVIK